MRLLVLLSLISLASCGGSSVQKKLSSADSLVITFDNTATGEAQNSVSTTERKAIRKLAGFVDGKEIAKAQCTYDGNITFYKDGKLLLAAIFNYTTDSCRHFWFDLDNKVIATQLSNEAADFLKSLAEGKNTY